MPKKRLLNRRRALWLGLGTFAGIGAWASGKGMYQSLQIQALDDPKRDFAVTGEASLKERAAAKGLIYGAAVDYKELTSNPAYADRFVRECNMLVPGSALKMGFIRPSPDRFNFTEGDALLNFARDRNMLVRGHTLVWELDFTLGPQWIRNTINSKNAEKVLTNHVKTVVGHYAGKIHSWDVVNEAIDPSDGRADGLAKTPWFQFLGPDYIDLAFRTAAEADPKALLVYNGDLLDHDTPDAEARRVATLKLLEGLKSKGTPVHALGIQAHLSANEPINFKKLKAFLHDVAGLGLKIMITELDVIDKKLPLDIDVRDRIVASVYEDYLSLVLEEPAVIAVITWGLTDRYTWHSGWNPRDDKAPVRPLPLDAQLKRKLAWKAIARAFDKAPKR
jgi:endo-1,4-beta-xylanase